MTATLVVLLGALAGCDRSGGGQDELVVLAASSLIEVMAEVESEYEAAHPGVNVVVSHAGSQVLAAQLLEGARADVFASADRAQMERAAEVVGEPAVFARNRLVLIVSGTSGAVGSEDRSIEEELRRDVSLVIAGESAPAGRYAREALEAMGLWEVARDRIVSYESDVRGVLAKVVMGEADAGIVYATDAAIAPAGSITVVPFPAGTVRAEYLIAVCDPEEPGSGEPGHQGERRGESFIAFVLGERGRAILRAHGFEAP